jgi:hypothetical protein
MAIIVLKSSFFLMFGTSFLLRMLLNFLFLMIVNLEIDFFIVDAVCFLDDLIDIDRSSGTRSSI